MANGLLLPRASRGAERRRGLCHSDMGGTLCGGIRALVLLREATHVVICADHDASGTGQRAAQDAAQRWSVHLASRMGIRDLPRSHSDCHKSAAMATSS